MQIKKANQKIEEEKILLGNDDDDDDDYDKSTGEGNNLSGK